LQESKTGTVSKLLLGNPGIKSHSDVGATERRRKPQREGGKATTPSIIRVIQIVQRGKEMPLDGDIVLLEDV
jgi:hypothetical protein